ncbi:MAG TPA: molybdenum cofactor guanylyltransferase [bacterium]|jgi:molybdopterin-guanine dinucleotide biosynthesis protein A|nr:molybdenum cofactor guanylyltransferase [bacterium]
MPSPESLTLAGALIAGGASRRFGRSKAKLPWGGLSLGSFLLGQMRAAGLEPLIYNATEALDDLPAGVRVVPDRTAGQGPLGGLASVLCASTVPVLVAACDMPGLDVDAFRALLSQWKPGKRGLVARGADGWHPLFGIYDPGLLPEIEQRLSQGRKAMHVLVEELGLEAWTPEPRCLVNINTVEEWENWKSI